MGSSPKTKSDYRKKIAEQQAKLAFAKAERARAKDRYTKDRFASSIAMHQAEIARLKAKMADAPSKKE